MEKICRNELLELFSLNYFVCFFASDWIVFLVFLSKPTWTLMALRLRRHMLWRGLSWRTNRSITCANEPMSLWNGWNDPPSGFDRCVRGLRCTTSRPKTWARWPSCAAPAPTPPARSSSRTSGNSPKSSKVPTSGRYRMIYSFSNRSSTNKNALCPQK